MCSSALYPEKSTPYYASLVRDGDPADPIGRQLILDPLEGEDVSGDTDPLGESAYSPLPGLIHAYPDRALVMPTGECLVNCRHCNRRHSRLKLAQVTSQRLDLWCDYVRAHPLIREVIVTGGDPLTLSSRLLAQVLERLRGIDTIDLLRVGSRAPVVAPHLITPELCSVLQPRASGLQPSYFMTQFNCPEECTPQAAAALELLASAGIPTGNQMVLLKGVNDDPKRVLEVNRFLLRHRCRPVYLFVTEDVRGTRHLQVPLERARAMARELRRSSGLASPRVVQDKPDAGGKTPVLESK